jgi:hypothetical protein
MQISKTFLTGGTLALCLLAIPALADDANTDAQLRDALRKKIAEPAGAPTAPAAVAPAAPAAPAQPAAAPVTQPVAQPAAVPTAVEDPADARLREALRQRMAQPIEHVAATPPKAAPAPATKKPTPAAPATEAKAAAPKMTPMEAPASPLAGSKEQRLAELLQQYKADKISPQEYHAARAKVIAGP